MTKLELARALAAHGESEDAKRAYLLVLNEADGSDSAAELEAAVYLFENGGDYRISLSTFHSLYNRGEFQEPLLDLIVNAFYAPNLKPQEQTYRRNCKLLEKYPYLFRKDFLPFEELPVKFFPFDEDGYLPFFTGENRFGDYWNPCETIVSRNFFHDLENPILTQDVYAQYELEYLKDNVRKSEWVARENHIYLHYTDWAVFCSYLQCIDLREALKEEKLVFLIEEEEALYPIDFKERFGIDYSQYTVKPISVREVNRLIWHTQISAHNGGDFFNEIFYGHPNLLADQSIMFDSLQELAEKLKKELLGTQQKYAPKEAAELLIQQNPTFDADVIKQLVHTKDVADKDILVAIFLNESKSRNLLDNNSRIAPAFFLQPHFHNIFYDMSIDAGGHAELFSAQYETIRNSAIFQAFKYVKTFTPLRRPTTSYASSLKFMCKERPEESESAVPDVIAERLVNRSYMVDHHDQLYRDSMLVRFEDAKLNPKATFTALAAFLDIPYTETMTYCSDADGINPVSMEGNVVGFDTATVYRTYDEYTNDTERYVLECFLQDAYEQYGYDFHYYDGAPVNLERVMELTKGFASLDGYIADTYKKAQLVQFRRQTEEKGLPYTEHNEEDIVKAIVNEHMARINKRREVLFTQLLRGLDFVNHNGQPLRMLPLLKLDPALLEQPLYH